MVSSDFRAEARRKLQGKWGKGALITLAYLAITFVIGFISGLLPESMETLISIATMVIEIPLSFGVVFAFLKLFNGEDVKAFDFLSLGFNNFKKSWGIFFQTLLKLIVPVILIVVSYMIISAGIAMAFASTRYSSASAAAGFSGLTIVGFILLIVSVIWGTVKSYYYELANLIAMDNPDLSAKDSVIKSQELMTGKRGKLFCLQLSFIGWAILAVIPFYIGLLWLMPYIQISIIAFYKFVSGNNSNVETEVTTENESPIQGE